MAPGVAAKVIAASCALSAFAVSVASGLMAGNPMETILGRALVCLVVGNVVGFVAGLLAERTIAEGVRVYQQSRPVPAGSSGGAPSGAASKISP